MNGVLCFDPWLRARVIFFKKIKNWPLVYSG